MAAGSGSEQVSEVCQVLDHQLDQMESTFPTEVGSHYSAPVKSNSFPGLLVFQKNIELQIIF